MSGAIAFTVTDVEKRRDVDVVAVARSGDWFASAGNDGTVRLWESMTGAELRVIPWSAFGVALFGAIGLVAVATGSVVSRCRLLENRDVEGLLRDELLQTGVLALQLLQPFKLPDLIAP